MSNINFTCPHCSHLMQLPAVLQDKQGKCPSCSSVVTISANAPANSTISPQQQIPQQQYSQQPLPLQTIDPELLQSTMDQQRKHHPQQQQSTPMIEAEQAFLEAEAEEESPDSGGVGCIASIAILLLLNFLCWLLDFPLWFY
jgi:acetyl-CoA carboxylase beta subunit